MSLFNMLTPTQYHPHCPCCHQPINLNDHAQCVEQIVQDKRKYADELRNNETKKEGGNKMYLVTTMSNFDLSMPYSNPYETADFIRVIYDNIDDAIDYYLQIPVDLSARVLIEKISNGHMIESKECDPDFYNSDP